jgi:hypothetical protein
VALVGVIALLYLLVVIIGLRVHATASPLRVDAEAVRLLNSSRVNAVLLRHHLGRLHSQRFLGRLVESR